MKIVTAAIPNGLEAPDVIAWAEASLASGGPGNASRKISQGLRGRNEFTIIVPPFQGEEVYLGMFTRGYARCASPRAITSRAFSPTPIAEQQRIVAKVDELLRWCDALEARLNAAQTTATHLLDALHQILSARL